MRNKLRKRPDGESEQKFEEEAEEEGEDDWATRVKGSDG